MVRAENVDGFLQFTTMWHTLDTAGRDRRSKQANYMKIIIQAHFLTFLRLLYGIQMILHIVNLNP